MLDGRWMSGLNRICSQEQLEQFVKLWSLVQQVSLLEGRRDAIVWTLTPDGKYSAQSAYNVQFLGRIKQPHLERVWKVRAEGKVQMFLWLLLQNRKWTAERLRDRGLQHDDRCCLCDQAFERQSIWPCIALLPRRFGMNSRIQALLWCRLRCLLAPFMAGGIKLGEVDWMSRRRNNCPWHLT
jgi:hypothetical protein